MENNKLSIEQRLALIEDYKQGVPLRELQTKYCVSRATIYWHIRRYQIPRRKVGRPALDKT